MMLTEMLLNVPTMRTNDQHQSIGPLIRSPSSCSEPVSDGQCPWSSPDIYRLRAAEERPNWTSHLGRSCRHPYGRECTRPLRVLRAPQCPLQKSPITQTSQPWVRYIHTIHPTLVAKIVDTPGQFLNLALFFIYTPWAIKKRAPFIFSITLANIDGFS